jgi:RNA polymerase sigma factor (sigma-70 family)
VADDTRMGGPSGSFPATRWSAILASRSHDPVERTRALDLFVAGYWKPVYKYLRLRWEKSSEDAKDLTQEFFTRLIEKGFLESYDPAKARLRTFLRTCVDGLVMNQDRDARRLKRGGDVQHLSLDFAAADGEIAGIEPGAPAEMEELFEKEWARSLFGLAVEKLRSQCAASGKIVHFRVFELYDLLDALPSGPDRRPSYDSLAKEFGISVTAVTNYLAFARREFRRITLETLREMTASEEEFRREARALLGAEPAPQEDTSAPLGGKSE